MEKLTKVFRVVILIAAWSAAQEGGKPYNLFNSLTERYTGNAPLVSEAICPKSSDNLHGIPLIREFVRDDNPINTS